MKIKNIAIDPNTQELLVSAQNADGTTTAVVWDIVKFIEGKQSTLRFATVEAGDDLSGLESEIVEVPMPGFNVLPSAMH